MPRICRCNSAISSDGRAGLDARHQHLVGPDQKPPGQRRQAPGRGRSRPCLHQYRGGLRTAVWRAAQGLTAADKQAFIDAAKEGVKLNRARVDADDATGVTELRAKGMTVIDNVDKAKFVAMLAPVNTEFEKQFGKANLDAIRAVK